MYFDYSVVIFRNSIFKTNLLFYGIMALGNMLIPNDDYRVVEVPEEI